MLALMGWVLMAAPLVLGGYAFVLYPAIVWTWSRWRPPFTLPPEPADWPEISILIVAYNEAGRLRRTLEHALAAARGIGFPVVAKILSPDIPHKSEIGGVILNIPDEGALADSFATLMAIRASACSACLNAAGSRLAKMPPARCCAGILWSRLMRPS